MREHSIITDHLLKLLSFVFLIPISLIGQSGDTKIEGELTVTKSIVLGDGLDLNTFIGYGQAGMVALGDHNTVFGAFAGQMNSNGNHNIFVGPFAGFSNSLGHRNVYVGSSAGRTNILGVDNVFIGYQAGYNNFQGSRNTFVGSEAGLNSTGIGNVFIGNSAGKNELGANRLYIHNNESSSPLVFGDFGQRYLSVNGNLGIGTRFIQSELHVFHDSTHGGGSTGLRLENSGSNENWWNFYTINSNGNLALFSKAGGGSAVGSFDDVSGTYTPVSDRRRKTNIAALSQILAGVMQLKPMTYQFRSQENGRRYIGLLAQEVKREFPELVYYDEISDLFTLDYASLSVIAIKAIQEQQVVIKELQQMVLTLQEVSGQNE